MQNRRRIIMYVGAVAVGIAAVELGLVRPVEWIATALGVSPSAVSVIGLLLAIGGWLVWLTIRYHRLVAKGVTSDRSPAE